MLELLCSPLLAGVRDELRVVDLLQRQNEFRIGVEKELARFG